MPRPWIPRLRFTSEFWGKPQILRISTLTGLDRFGVTGRLVWFWIQAQVKANSGGVLEGKSLAWLNQAVGTAGFAEAMMDVGWLEVAPLGIKVPAFDEFVSKRAIGKAEKAEAQLLRRLATPGTTPRTVTQRSSNEATTKPYSDGKVRKVTAARLGGPMFDRFWAAWPKKVSKTDAMKAFRELDPNEELLGRILAAIEWQVRSQQWVKDDGQFIPYPASWLNGRRWEDDPASGGPVQSGPRIKPKPGQFKTGRDLSADAEGPDDGGAEAGGGSLF